MTTPAAPQPPFISSINLPAPRLELRWRSTARTGEYICTYALVIPLGEGDIRREHEDGRPVRDCLTVPLSRTRTDGAPPLSLSGIDTPFRDGAHAQYDSEALGGLPVFAIYEEQAQRIER